MDADGAWTKSNICSRIPGLVMVSSETSLSMIYVKRGAGIHLVLDRRGGDILLTASKGRTVKLWNREHGECLTSPARVLAPRALAASVGASSAGLVCGYAPHRLPQTSTLTQGV